MKGPQTIEKCPVVAELKLEMSKSFFSRCQFQLCHKRVLLNLDFTFLIYHVYGPLFKNVPQSFDKLCIDIFSFMHS